MIGYYTHHDKQSTEKGFIHIVENLLTIIEAIAKKELKRSKSDFKNYIQEAQRMVDNISLFCSNIPTSSRLEAVINAGDVENWIKINK